MPQPFPISKTKNNHRRASIILGLFLLAAISYTAYSFFHLRYSPFNEDSSTKSFLSNVQNQKDNLFSDRRKTIETAELSQLAQKSPELLATYAQKRSQQINIIGEEIFHSLERNKLGFLKKDNQTEKIPNIKFLQTLSQHAYQSTGAETNDQLSLLDQLRDSDNFKTYLGEKTTSQEIIPTITTKDDQLTTVETPYHVELPQKISQPLIFNQKNNADATKLSLSLQGASDNAPKIYDNKALYPETKKGVDALLTTDPDGTNQAFLIKNPQSFTTKTMGDSGFLTLNYTLNADLTPTDADGAIIFSDSENTKQYVFTPPSITDTGKKHPGEAKFTWDKAEDHINLRLEIKLPKDISFPLIVSFDLLPALSTTFQGNEVTSPQQQAVLQKLDLPEGNTTQGSDYLSDNLAPILPDTAKALLKLPKDTTSEKIKTQTSSDVFASKLDLPKEEKPKTDQPQDPRQLPGDAPTQLNVQTAFDNLTDQVAQTVSMSNGSQVSSFKIRLKNSDNYRPAVYQGEAGDTKVYFGKNDLFSYIQTTNQKDSQISLKENILATNPNQKDNTSYYAWDFSGTDKNSKITLEQQPDGSIFIFQEQTISGVDPNDQEKQQHINDLVKTALGTGMQGRIQVASIRPPVYTTKDGTQKTATYELDGNTLSITIQEDRSSYPLLIDPTLDWLQWMGSMTTTAADSVLAIAVDNDNVYVGGYTNGSSFVQSFAYIGGAYTAGYDGFVVELIDNASAAPTLSWFQWLGGLGTDRVRAIGVVGSEIYVGGYVGAALSQSFTYTGGSYYGSGTDSFVVELIDNAGAAPTANWVQYLGGSGTDYFYAMEVSNDEIYVGGIASSTLTQTFAYTGGSYYGSGYDIWVVELDDNASAAPTLAWLQWLGGSSSDYVQEICVNGDEVYVGGYVSSAALNQSFAYTGGSYTASSDGFVVELIDNAGAAPTRSWLQWLGGSGTDYVYSLAVTDDEIYAGGQTSATLSQSFSYTGGSYTASVDGFVAELDDNASAAPTLAWLQWLGGSGVDSVTAVTVTGDEVYAGGAVSSALSQTFTYTGGSFTSGQDGFVVELSDNASAAPTRAWLQYLGGSGTDYVNALAVTNDEIYAGGYANAAISQSFTYTGGSYTSSYDGFAVELGDNASAAPTLAWIQWLGGTGSDGITAMAVNGDEVYAGGYANAALSQTFMYSGGSFTSGNEGIVVELGDNASAAPTLAWIQWLSGLIGAGDYAYAVAIGDNGEVYVGGSMVGTSGISFSPTYTGGSYTSVGDGFVVELQDNGFAAPTVNWLQWLGGSGSDQVNTLAVAGDEIYACGQAGSAFSQSFNYTGGSYTASTDGFVVELDDNASAAPTLAWIQWLGGSGADFVFGLAVTGDEIYAGGTTTGTLSQSFAYTGGSYTAGNDGFVVELDDNASAAPTTSWLQWLGGSGADQILALAVNDDEIYAGGVAAATLSQSFTYTGGSYTASDDGFVVELIDNASAAPTRSWIQWLGGSDSDYVQALVVTGDEIYAGGYAWTALSQTFTYTGGSYTSGDDGFVVELDDNASAAPTRAWLQYLGGSGGDGIYALAVNGDEIYAGGYASATFSQSFTYTGGTYTTGYDGFVVELDDNTSAVPTTSWIEWLGGTGTDYIRALAVSGDEIYASGYLGSGVGLGDVPYYTGVAYSGGQEALVVRISDINDADPVVFLNTPANGATGQSTTPALSFTGVVGSDETITYEIQICGSADSSCASPLYDKVSGTDAGFSGTPDNSDPFTSGQQVTYTVQTALTAGATYYWRVRGIDPSGSNTYGGWSSAWSFTVAGGEAETYSGFNLRSGANLHNGVNMR